MESWESPLLSYLVQTDQTSSLGEGLWGFEREAQRITPSGDLSLEPRPDAGVLDPRVGSITVDFAESQAELISAPQPSISGAMDALGALHDRMDAVLGDQRLWPFSMPPRLPDEADIPLAVFDDSPEGRAQASYRRSLADRYGKKMQMISGLHYNFSYGPALIEALWAGFAGSQSGREFSDRLYLAAARNFFRHRWLLILLFGASPVADRTYAPVLEKELELVRACCPGAAPEVRHADRYAVSLRVSRYGYANRGRRRVRFDDLATYLGDLGALVSSGALQKESEFYSPLRIKQIPEAGESPSQALERRGVRYLEVRLLDLDPYERLGLSAETARLVHLFLLFCLLEPWDPLSDEEAQAADRNHHAVALAGRRSGLRVVDFARGPVTVTQAAQPLLAGLETLARVLDGSEPGPYVQAVDEARARVEDRRRLPSSRILHDLATRRERFADFGLRLSQEEHHALVR